MRVSRKHPVSICRRQERTNTRISLISKVFKKLARELLYLLHNKNNKVSLNKNNRERL